MCLKLRKGNSMKLIIGIAICTAIFFAALAFYARVLYLMGCCAGDLSADVEPDLASVEPSDAAEIANPEVDGATAQKAQT